MNHFPIAFGTIVAVVLGGAFLFDHSIKDSGTASRTTPPTTSVAESKAPPATLASTDSVRESPASTVAGVADAGDKASVDNASSDGAVSASRSQEIGASKTTKSPTKKLASTSKASAVPSSTSTTTMTPSTPPSTTDTEKVPDNTTPAGNPPPDNSGTNPPSPPPKEDG